MRARPNARNDDDDDDRGAGSDAAEYYCYIMTTATGATRSIVHGARARAPETEIESFTRA